MKTDPFDFAADLRGLAIGRRTQNLTQEAVAEASGLDLAQVQAIEAGECDSMETFFRYLHGARLRVSRKDGLVAIAFVGKVD